MSYKALYRTYRPSTFNEVYGQNHIVRTLTNAIKENKIAHAYLFCGPRGTGKTSMARLFAKALNCEKGFGHQCNCCPNCIAISEGTHPDVIEIDAASNRGIDDIRDLINKVKYAPIKGKYKVYIIDEVHMMTSEAFNALLKTLEEPPANVVFILATTEPYKLMPTILSRVQRYDFSKVSDKDLLDNLIRVCDKEKVVYNREALNLIVSLSDGGVRDSLSLLDQAIAFSSNSLNVKIVQELFGLSTVEEKISLLNAIKNGDIISCTNKLDTLVEHGIDIKRLTSDLIEILKDVLIYQTTKDSTITKVLDKEKLTTLKLTKDDAYKMIDTLVETYSQFRFVTNIKSLLEISFLKLASYCSASKEQISSTPEIVKSNNQTKEVSETKKVEEKPIITQEKFNVTPLVEEGEMYQLSEEDTINIMQQGDKLEKNKIIEKWDLIDDYLSHDQLGKYATTLKSCSPRIVAKDTIVLETNFIATANKIKIKANQNGFRTLLRKITNKDYVVLVLTRQESIDRVQKFANLRQANKLPEIYKIEIDL